MAEEQKTQGADAQEEEDSRMVALVSQEGDSFNVSMAVARMSELVKTMIDDDQDDADETQEIPLPNVKATVLSKVIEFCTHHHANPMAEIEKPLKSANMHEVVVEWDANFVDIVREVVAQGHYMFVAAKVHTYCVYATPLLHERPLELSASRA